MSEVVAAIARIIPGAPASESTLSKSQKKRRRGGKKGDADEPTTEPVTVPDTTTAALIDHAPALADIREGSVAPSLVAAPESTGSPLQGESDLLLKNSPIVELVTKRLKATTKKIGRVAGYAVTDPAKLNDDQKRSLQGLPALEAVQKELGEVKKVIEVYEAELSSEIAAKRAETEKAADARVQSAVESAQNDLVSKTSDLLSLSRARNLVGSGAVDSSNIFSDENESVAFFSLTDVVFGEDTDKKQAAINGFLFGNDDFEGVPFTRIYEILNLILRPPRAPTPDQPLIDDRQQSDSAPSITDEVERPVFVAGAPPVTSTGLSFMQESEIEPGAEWVETPAEAAAPEPVADEQPTKGPEASAAPVGGDGSTLDWAADPEGEDELPSIEHFKTSGSATPAEQTDTAAAPAASTENGTAEEVDVEEGLEEVSGRDVAGSGVKDVVGSVVRVKGVVDSVVRVKGVVGSVVRVKDAVNSVVEKEANEVASEAKGENEVASEVREESVVGSVVVREGNAESVVDIVVEVVIGASETVTEDAVGVVVDEAVLSRDQAPLRLLRLLKPLLRNLLNQSPLSSFLPSLFAH
ncbi:hypothetical protein BKA70DRAFT_1182739 [Coprinopsis sp. MPI-PUGE-AT-0042]|nr:hypothetical protein BKA70DRAFT_1182739 [Coprinopsis sp. MPI-PUGE-AT-0042]